MAKNKKRVDKSKSKKGDDKVNLIIRLNQGENTNIFINECIKSYPLSLIKNIINQIKDVYYRMDKREVDGLVDESYFMVIFNYVEELFLTIDIDKNIDFVERSTYYRKKIVEFHKDNDIKWELFIYINKVSVLLENPRLYENEKYNTERDLKIVKAITDVLYCFYMYCFTYVEKVKNKKFKCFRKEDSHVVLEYENRIFAEPELLQGTYYAMSNRIPVTEKQYKCTASIIAEIDRIYANFVSQKINADYYKEVQGFLTHKGETKLPIVYDESKMLSEDLLNKIPFGRKYAFSSAGVRFNFLNKDDGVDYIDMVESKDSISLNVYLINDGNFYTTKRDVNGLDWVESEEIKAAMDKSFKKPIAEKVTGKRIKIPFYMQKDSIKETDTIYDKLAYLSPIGYVPDKSDSKSLELFTGLAKLVLCCIYCAYYDLNVFKGILNIGGRERKNNENALPRHRASSFRVAHLRKLPVGRKASAESLANAKKEGFDYIEEGYTFVRAFVPNENEKKVIDI